MSDLSPYQTDHLFLLIGTNPLPNYVAARLLAKAETTIWLLHSEGQSGKLSTQKAAARLKGALQVLRNGGKLTYREAHLEPVPSSDDQKITRKIQQLLCKEGIEGTVGLHYTGGTKPMAVHVYRALEQAWAEKREKPIFSYLDPRKLALRVDGYGTRNSALFPILADEALRAKTEIALAELLALHGYRWKPKAASLKPSSLLDALTQLHTTQDGIKQWQEWLETERKSNRDRKLQALPNPSIYSALQPVVDVLDELCNGQATAEAVATLLGFKHLDSAYKWLRGEWLEEVAYTAIEQCRTSLPIHSAAMNITPVVTGSKPKNLELDAAALVGYQLFAVSCIASANASGETKKHLFECYVRARQLGGDEARAGLVCFVESGDILCQELARDWDAEGKIQVFDRNDLKNLPAAFEEWFRTASG